MSVALVTGAAVRIGRAIALALADKGLDIVVHYRRSEAQARELCRVLELRGVRAWPLQADFVAGQVLYVDGGRHLKEYEHHGSDSHP